jgi:hypothetical protein
MGKFVGIQPFVREVHVVIIVEVQSESGSFNLEKVVPSRWGEIGVIGIGCCADNGGEPIVKDDVELWGNKEGVEVEDQRNGCSV